MFTSLMEERVPNVGPDLWTQCLKELERIGQPFMVDDVNRLALLVSHDAYGDFTSKIQEVVSDTVNGFMDELPF